MPIIARSHCETFPLRMTINPEISIGSINVEATARINKRRIVQCRKSSKQECPQPLYIAYGHQPLILLWMEHLPSPVMTDFDHVLARVKREAIPASSCNIGSKDDEIRWGKQGG